MNTRVRGMNHPPERAKQHELHYNSPRKRMINSTLARLHLRLRPKCRCSLHTSTERPRLPGSLYRTPLGNTRVDPGCAAAAALSKQVARSVPIGQAKSSLANARRKVVPVTVASVPKTATEVKTMSCVGNVRQKNSTGPRVNPTREGYDIEVPTQVTREHTCRGRANKRPRRSKRGPRAFTSHQERRCRDEIVAVGSSAWPSLRTTIVGLAYNLTHATAGNPRESNENRCRGGSPPG